jgi:hypothetical protein
MELGLKQKDIVGKTPHGKKLFLAMEKIKSGNNKKIRDTNHLISIPFFLFLINNSIVINPCITHIIVLFHWEE